ncbi:MAG TPA: hypothetical protein DIU15_16705, partial [Deltaproteobacteria bacterium]|nr:hypothetical protein [Deltaproteobacteria bacterium]
SVVKFGSGHRVAVHDARTEPGGNRALRSVAAIFRPNVAVLWLHPATLGDGLEAARAVRQAGCELVLGTGPLVDLWPDGAGRIPELDGLLASAGSSTLLSALDAVAEGAGSQELVSVLASSPEALTDLPVDRKLVDYARYSKGVAPPWPSVAPVDLSRGRWKQALLRRTLPQSGVSPVFLHAEDGQLLPSQVVVNDIKSSTLLGIRTFDLVARPGCSPPGGSWLDEFLRTLSPTGGAVQSSLCLRLPVDPAKVDDIPLLDLPALGVVAVDLGEVTAGDEMALKAAIGAASRCRRRDLQPTGTLVVGRPGYGPEVEVRGLERAVGERFPTWAGVEVRLGTVDPGAWGDWLDAPSPGFRPPGVDDERTALAQRGRDALAVVPPPPPNLRRLVRWAYRMGR